MAVDRSKTIQNAQRYTARGQIDKAIEEWQKLVSITPNDGNLFNSIGDLYLKKNDTHHAIETFMRAAEAYERAGFALKTIAVYKKILKIDPSCLEVHLKMADLNAERGLTGNAIEDYLKVAKEFGRKGKIADALEIYRKIANFDPTNTNIRLKLAELSLREKLQSEAIEEYMKVAQIYEQNSRSADAADLYKKILELDPKHTAAKDALKGTVTPESPALPTVPDIQQAMDQDDWDLAAEKVNVLLLHEPTSLELRRLRGVVLLHQGKTDQAWIDIRAVVDESVRVGDGDRGIELLQEALAVTPGQVEAAEMLAKLLDCAGRAEEARSAYAALIELVVQDDASIEDAREFYKRLKVLDPTGESIAPFRERFGDEEAVEDAPAQVDEPSAVAEAPVDHVQAEEILEEQVAASPSADESPVVAEALADDVQAEEILEEQVAATAGLSTPSGSAAVESTIDAINDITSVIDEATRGGETSVEELVSYESRSEERQVEPGPVYPEPVEARETTVPPPPVNPPATTPPPAKAPSVSSSDLSLSVSRLSASMSQSKSRSKSATPSPPRPSRRIKAKDLPDYFAEAEVYLKYGLAGKAIEQYQLILTVDTNNIEAHAKLRELYQLEGRVDEAVSQSVVLARLYNARGEHDEAEMVLSEAREWSPEDPRLQPDYAETSVSERPVAEKSLSQREPSEASHPSAAEPEGGAAYGDGGDEAELTVQRPKQDLQEWLAEAEFYLQQGLGEQAHQLFVTIRQHYPSDPAVLAYFESYQADSAGAREAGAVAPADDSLLGSHGLDELADVLNHSAPSGGEEKEDSAVSSALADIFPGVFRGVHPSAERGTAENGANNGAAAGDSQKPPPPSGPDPHFSLGLAYKEMGLHAEARKELEQTLALPDYAINASLMIADCHKAEGHPELGAEQLLRCLESLGESDEPWIKVAFAVGVFQAQAGQVAQAIGQMERVLAVQSGFEPAVKLLKELRQLEAPPAAEASAPTQAERSVKEAAEEKGKPRKEPDKRRRISYV